MKIQLPQKVGNFLNLATIITPEAFYSKRLREVNAYIEKIQICTLLGFYAA
jgi:hypothetical protein